MTMPGKGARNTVIPAQARIHGPRRVAQIPSFPRKRQSIARVRSPEYRHSRASGNPLPASGRLNIVIPAQAAIHCPRPVA
jgi:hypothetical protein